MKSLVVLYDAGCPFCLHCRDWMRRREQWVPVEFVAANSPVANRRFPSLKPGSCGDLTVVDNAGGVYRGPAAFIICLYALADYREWSLRLARPGLLPWAKRAFILLSKNRQRLSRALLLGERATAKLFREPDANDPSAACPIQSRPAPRPPS